MHLEQDNLPSISPNVSSDTQRNDGWEPFEIVRKCIDEQMQNLTPSQLLDFLDLVGNEIEMLEEIAHEE